MIRRTLLALAGAVALTGAVGLGGLAACSSAGASGTGPASVSGQRNGVVLKVGDQKAGSRALLAAAGLLDGTPYRIEWSEFTSGPPLLEALNAGAIDIGGVGDTPPIFSASAGSRIVLVGASYAEPRGAAILVPRNSGITDVSGLKGRKVAVAKGSSANAHLLNALRKAGLTFHDITPAYLQPADALAAFSNGSIDAWAIWDPYTALAQEKTGARILIDGTGGLQSGLGFQVASPAALADRARSDAVHDYLQRLAQARRWTQSHQDAWATAWAKEAGIPVSVAKAAVARANQHAVPIDDSLIRSEQATADAFADAGLIPKRLDIAAITDRRFNDTASAA
jgi:sulfonate transport system substrate-binding protein